MLYTNGEIIFSERNTEELFAFLKTFPHIKFDIVTEENIQYAVIPQRNRGAKSSFAACGCKQLGEKEMDEIIKLTIEQKKEKENGKANGRKRKGRH